MWVLVSSKIAQCSHAPTVFPYLFSVKHVCLPPSSTVNINISCSLKRVNVSLFPTIFFLCYIVPQTPGSPSIVLNANIGDRKIRLFDR